MLGRAKNQGGFTLVELMICVAIIGILASIAIPNYIRYRQRGMVAHAQAELKTIQTAITMLALDSNCYPSGDRVTDFEDGGPDFYLDNDPEYGLTGADGDFLDDVADAGGIWVGPYMRNMPKDPWAITTGLMPTGATMKTDGTMWLSALTAPTVSEKMIMTTRTISS